MNFHIDWPAAYPARTGATPLWHPEEARLYWCDGTSLFRLDPERGVNELCFSSDRPIGAMTLEADGSILLFRDQANVAILRDGVIVKTVIASISDFRLSSFASAAADSRGRVVCSVLSDAHHTGRLLMLGDDGRLETVMDGFFFPGGLAFDATCTHLFFNDSHATRLRTWVFDYDPDLGAIGDGRVFYDVLAEDDDNRGAPAGLAIDSDGAIWVARSGGSCIVRHAPDGPIAARCHMTVRKPFGLAFGGAELEDLYVTTVGGHRRAIEGLHAGDLARVRSEGVRGVAPFRSRIGAGGAEEGE